MSVSKKTGAAHVRPVDEEFNAERAVETAAPEAKDNAAPVVEAATTLAASGAPAKPKRRSFIMPVVGLALLAGAGWYGYDYWTDGRFMISTDDAYVEGDITQISPKVAGYVEKVNVVANQRVKAGDPLV